MGLRELQGLDLDALLACRLTAEEAYAFLVNLNNVIAGASAEDLPQVYWRSSEIFKSCIHC